MMRAVLQPGKTSADLIVGSVPIPVPANREVLIKVQYSALNRMDLLQAKGSPPPPGVTDILGCEVSGTIVSAAEGAQRGFKEGDQVMALLPGGGYADYCVCDERTVSHVPGGLDLRTAAAIPEAFATAYQLLFFVANLQPGESVLLHAAASSVGQAAIQLAKQKGITVYATARGDEKCAKCVELGAAAAFKVGEDCSFSAAVLAATNGKGVNAVLDPVGASYILEDIAVTALDGRIVIYGLMAGGHVQDPTFLTKLMAKRIRLLPTTLRTRSIEYKETLIEAVSSDPGGLPAIASGAIKVEVFTTFPLEQVVASHALMTSNENTGKILLVL